MTTAHHKISLNAISISIRSLESDLDDNVFSEVESRAYKKAVKRLKKASNSLRSVVDLKIKEDEYLRPMYE